MLLMLISKHMSLFILFKVAHYFNKIEHEPGRFKERMRAEAMVILVGAWETLPGDLDAKPSGFLNYWITDFWSFTVSL